MLRLSAVALCAVMVSCAVDAAVEEGTIEICFNYGCAARAPVEFDAAAMEAARVALGEPADALAERAAIAVTVGVLYRIAGTQTPISFDRAGNLADAGAHGRMDCIDHATNTTRFLELLESWGWLRFHKVLEPARRSAFILLQHFSAVIEELDVPRTPRLDARSQGTLVPIPELLVLCDCEQEQSGLPVLADRDAAAAQTRPGGQPGGRFVIDSWFVEHGEPAVILPLTDWLNGEGPNVQ